jgi:hypothetical protein
VMLYPHIYTYVYYLLLVACYTILQRPNWEKRMLVMVC